MNGAVISMTIGTISAAASMQTATSIVFYINLCFVFCALVSLTAVVVLCKKTSCAIVLGMATALTFGCGIIVFVVQVALYSILHAAAAYVVYFCAGLLYCGFIVGGAYCIMLSRNSHSALCIASGVCGLFPPLGVTLTVILSYKIDRDTRSQSLIFNGYAYTYAVLGEFCEKNKAAFIDSASDVKKEHLTKKQIRKLLKTLKKHRSAPEDAYEYATAVMYYTPINYKKALRSMVKAAEAKYVPALFNLGYYYEKGLYVKKDIKKAKSYYVKAADAGDTDAALRLGIIAAENGSAQEAIHIFQDRVDSAGDICAKYNIGVCHELGVGVPQNIGKAFEIFAECANAGLLAAQKHIFSLAAMNINKAQIGELFRLIVNHSFVGTFNTVIKGLMRIKERRAADAADIFLSVVKKHDDWEGVARCIVGTLYIDCGKLFEDRHNGAEYIKSAVPLYPDAKNIYNVVSKCNLNKKRKTEKKEKNKKTETDK